MSLRPGGRVFLAIALLFAAATPAGAETVYRERIENFDISGYVNSRKQLWESIRDWGPSRDDRFIVGTARPRFAYKYKYNRRGGRCRVTNARVSVNVVLRLPQWHLKDIAKPDLQRYFGCVLRTVTVHEKRHGQIAYEAGQQIEAALYRELSDVPCNGMKKRADTIFRRVLAKHTERQNAFDRADYARRRYQQCNNSDGPRVSLRSTPMRRSFADRPPPTRRFDRPETEQQRRHANAGPKQSLTRPEVPPAAPEATRRLLGGAGFLFAAVSSALGLFAAVMWGAVRLERHRELQDLGGDTSIASSSPTTGTEAKQGRTRSAGSRRNAGFGKRTPSRS